MEERMKNGAADILEGGERLGRIDDAAAAGGKLLERESLTAPEQRGGRRAVDVEDKSRTGHQRFRSFSPRGADAALTAPPPAGIGPRSIGPPESAQGDRS